MAMSRFAVKWNMKSGLPLATGQTGSNQRDKDLLHRSILATDHFQDGLPRLTIPPLEKTCERYLKAQEALLSPENYHKTWLVTEAFRRGPGHELHAALLELDKRNKHTSFISEPMLDLYLRDRRPVAANVNSRMTFKDVPSHTHKRSVAANVNSWVCIRDDPRGEFNIQLLRAVNLIISSLKFMQTFRANVLEPSVYHVNPTKSDTPEFRNFVRLLPKSLSYYGAVWYNAFPLDMSQFPNLFASSRIPSEGRDRLYTDPTAKHILVMRKGRLFVFDVLDDNGDIKPFKEIMTNLHNILSGSMSPVEHPVGILTTLDRDRWAKTRELLVNQGNERILKAVDGALFNLVLDDSCSDDLSQISSDLLHGGGCNRWFDKSLSLIVNGIGKTGVNFEHSCLDGHTVVRYIEEIFDDSTKYPALCPADLPRHPAMVNDVIELGFALNDEVKQIIRDARSEFTDIVASLSSKYTVNTKIVKEGIQKAGLSPDAFLQLAIQLAYYKMYGTTASYYEACSMAAFKHGRTEAIRSCTTTSKRTCEMFHDSQCSAQDRMIGMMQCSKVHKQLVKEAITGHAFDGHLYALKYYASLAGQIPDLYLDPSYITLNRDILATSTLRRPAAVAGGFPPYDPDGYGIGYGYDAKHHHPCIIIAAYEPQSADDLIQALDDAITDMCAVLNKAKTSTTPE